MDYYDIERGLESLIGKDKLEKYKKWMKDVWKDSREYWDDVDAQSQKDIDKLMVFFSFREGKLGFWFSPNAESDSNRWVSIDEPIGSELDADNETRTAIAIALRDAADQLEAHNA